MRIKVIILFLLFVTYRINHADGQVNIPTDTLRLTIQKAEEKFLSKNILLLAEKCNIDAAKASIIQAKLWDNPTLNFEQSFSRYQDYDSSLDLSQVEKDLSDKIVVLLVEDIFNQAFVNW